MDFFRPLLMTIMVLVPLCLCADEDKDLEQAFYATSSLRYAIEQLAESNQGDSIVFDLGDIERLWFKLYELLPDEGAVSIAHQAYLYVHDQHKTGNLSQECLDVVQEKIYKLWDSLRRVSIGDAGSILEKPFHPNISNDAQKAIRPYLLSPKHPTYETLDAIFCQSRISRNEETFVAAGFTFLDVASTSYIRVAKHQALPGYLVKVYLDNSEVRKGKPGWYWLSMRCKGASNIRELIARKKIKYFAVPDKYLYRYPPEPSLFGPSGISPQPVILLVTDMGILDHRASEIAWKTQVTYRHLTELYEILSHGYGTTYLALNVPYTKDDVFAFIDTEFPKRKLEYGKVKPYLSVEMAEQWDRLVKRK